MASIIIVINSFEKCIYYLLCFVNNINICNKYFIITCLSPPALTIAIIMFSVAIKGSTLSMFLDITLENTVNPSRIFCNVNITLSAAKNASDKHKRLISKKKKLFKNLS